MEKKTIAVLFGGCSTEYEVSLQSAYSVINGLSPEKYALVLLGITRQGVWLRYDGPAERIANDTWAESGACVPAVISPDRDTHGLLVCEAGRVTLTRLDVAFPVLHGRNGEDGTVQGLLELAGIPFVGCRTLSSAICMDKDCAHQLAQLAGVKTPRSLVLAAPGCEAGWQAWAEAARYPLFVKPANAGSSIGITQVRRAEQLPEAIALALAQDAKVIIEEAVEGVEVGCAILGTDTLCLGELDEIEVPDGFFDYVEKYTLKTAKIHLPARVDPATATRIKQTAVTVYRALGCSGLARVDLFVTPQQEIYFNEVNTLPGFTSHSRFPAMLQRIGLTFEQIVDRLVSQALCP